MAESCDASNQRIIDAFKKHYDKLMTAMGPCVMEVARVLYQERLISDDTKTAAHDMSVGEQVRGFKVVNAVEAYIKVCNSSSKQLKILSTLEKHPPLNVVVVNILQDAGVTSECSGFSGESYSHYQKQAGTKFIFIFYFLLAIEDDTNKSTDSLAVRPKLKSETFITWYMYVCNR